MIMKHKSQWKLILIFYPNLNTVLPFAINTVWAEVKGAAFSNSGQKSLKTSPVIGVYTVLEEESRSTSDAKPPYVQESMLEKIFLLFNKVILGNTTSSLYLLQDRLLTFEIFFFFFYTQIIAFISV